MVLGILWNRMSNSQCWQIFMEPLCSNVKWSLPFIPMMDFSSVRLSPSIGNKKTTIFYHYVIMQPLPKYGWFFGATLFICKMVSAFHSNGGFFFRWSFPVCSIQKSNYFWLLCHHTPNIKNGWFFWSHFEFFRATLFKCKMVSAVHTNDGFLFRWSFSLCWKQISKYIWPYLIIQPIP